MSTLVVGYLQDPEEVSHTCDECSGMQDRVDGSLEILRLWMAPSSLGGHGECRHIYQPPHTGRRFKRHGGYFVQL